MWPCFSTGPVSLGSLGFPVELRGRQVSPRHHSCQNHSLTAMHRPRKPGPFLALMDPFKRGPWPLNRRKWELLTLHGARDRTLSVGS